MPGSFCGFFRGFKPISIKKIIRKTLKIAPGSDAFSPNNARALAAANPLFLIVAASTRLFLILSVNFNFLKTKFVRSHRPKILTIWPFCFEEVNRLAQQVDLIVVPEMNLGQMVLEVERAAR